MVNDDGHRSKSCPLVSVLEFVLQQYTESCVAK